MKRCETCKYWNKGDRRSGDKKISNAGLCTWLTDYELIGPHFMRFRVPFWARGIMRHTISFDGEGCEVWLARDKMTEVEKSC